MNLLQRVTSLFEKRSNTYQWYDLLAGAATPSGVIVNEDNAMRYSAVYACVRIISESIASLPLVLYRQQGRSKGRALDHPLFPVLHDLPNPEMTSLEWRELMMAHCLLRGNGWSQKETNFRGQTIELWPLNPEKMEGWERRGGKLYWLYRNPDNRLEAINSDRIHHIKGLGDGLWGRSPIEQTARHPIGLGLATEEFGARFFSNGAHLNKILKHPGKLSPQAYERLKASVVSESTGLSNAHKTKILEEGMSIEALGIAPNEAQFLETRKFQVTEIARIFRVPPHMLADLDRATFSNIEHQSLNFVMYSLRPWLVRHEQAIYRDLLLEGERNTYFAKYIVEGLLRGDMASRYAAYTSAITAGHMTRNEARELEDRNPLEGLDEPLLPLNMMEVGATPPAPAPPPQRYLPIDRETRAIKTSADRRALMNRNVRLFEDAAARVVKRETHDIRLAAKSKLGKRDAKGFATWLEDFYKQLRTWFPDYFKPLMLSYAESIMASVAAELDGEPAPLDDELREWIDGYLANYTEVYAVGGEKQLRALLAESEGDEEAEKAINERMDGWDETKAGKEGFAQAFEAGNALAIFGYTAGGVSFLRWVANSGACPICQKFDGRRIKIGGAFVDEGDKVEAEGVDPLPIVRKISHGPLHSGCSCTVVAG